jgi:hypothetical protein
LFADRKRTGDYPLETCLDRKEPPDFAETIERIEDHIVALRAPGNFVFAA